MFLIDLKKLQELGVEHISLDDESGFLELGSATLDFGTNHTGHSLEESYNECVRLWNEYDGGRVLSKKPSR